MDLYRTKFIFSYIDLNKFIGFRGILLYTESTRETKRNNLRFILPNLDIEYELHTKFLFMKNVSYLYHENHFAKID